MQNTLVKYIKIYVDELISNQSGKPLAGNFIKSKIPLEEYFKDFVFFLRAYIKNFL